MLGGMYDCRHVDRVHHIVEYDSVRTPGYTVMED